MAEPETSTDPLALITQKLDELLKVLEQILSKP